MAVVKSAVKPFLREEKGERTAVIAKEVLRQEIIISAPARLSIIFRCGEKKKEKKKKRASKISRIGNFQWWIRYPPILKMKLPTGLNDVSETFFAEEIPRRILFAPSILRIYGHYVRATRNLLLVAESTRESGVPPSLSLSFSFTSSARKIYRRASLSCFTRNLTRLFTLDVRARVATEFILYNTARGPYDKTSATMTFRSRSAGLIFHRRHRSSSSSSSPIPGAERFVDSTCLAGIFRRIECGKMNEIAGTCRRRVNC